MSVREKTRWREWADRLRQEMMAELTPEVTKSVDSITRETGTDKSRAMLHSQRFWHACQTGKGPHDTLVKAGFEIEYQANEHSEIDTVTLRLNHTWKAIMQRVLDRKPTRP
jgi:hypothetical protein